MAEIFFFVPEGPYNLADLTDELSGNKSSIKISDIKTLDKATKNDITFFNSLDYKELANKTKASACITTRNLQNYLPKECLKIITKSVYLQLLKLPKNSTLKLILIILIIHLFHLKVFHQIFNLLHLVRIILLENK